jgi:hypothetical protein
VCYRICSFKGWGFLPPGSSKGEIEGWQLFSENYANCCSVLLGFGINPDDIASQD